MFSIKKLEREYDEKEHQLKMRHERKLSQLRNTYSEATIELDEKLHMKKKELEEEEIEWRRKGLSQRHDFEHEFHEGKEERMTKLARLDGEIEAKSRYLNETQKLLEEKQKIIELLIESNKTVINK